MNTCSLQCGSHVDNRREKLTVSRLIVPRQILHWRSVDVYSRATAIQAHQLVPALWPHAPVVARLLAQRQSQALVRYMPESANAPKGIRRTKRFLYSFIVDGVRHTVQTALARENFQLTAFELDTNVHE